jgi:hypothetical protein
MLNWDRYDVSSDEGEDHETPFDGWRGDKSTKPRVAPDLRLILERVRTGELPHCPRTYMVVHDMQSGSSYLFEVMHTNHLHA